MPSAADPKCVLCKGSGYEVVDARRDVSVVCPCMRRDVSASRLGRIAQAPRIASSPLEGRTGENLLVVGLGKVIDPHFRRALEGAPKLTFRETTDLEILDTTLGKGTRAAEMTGEDRERISIYDLVRAPDLLLIRAFEVQWKNQALPGYLFQVLRVREFAGRATWIHAEQPIVRGHYCWSEDLAAYLGDMFQLVRFDGGGVTKSADGTKGGTKAKGPQNLDIDTSLFGGKR